MAEKVVIIGDGAMGTVCGLILAQNGHDVTIWSHTAEQSQKLQAHRENRLFLPGLKLPESMRFTAADTCLQGDISWVVSAIPCKFLHPVWKRLAPHVPNSLGIVSITKGIENDTLARPTEIILNALGSRPIAVLSGPNIADELARQLPATSTVASTDEPFAQKVQAAFTAPWLRIYTNTDLIGVELAGATKNVIAIAAGLIDGLGAGDNAKAALLTRGLVEISRLGVAQGAQAETFFGLSGMGDLVTTCVSPKGRNRSFGQALAQGKTLAEVLAEIPGEVEGVNTCRSVHQLAKKCNTEMPITEAVFQILFKNKPIKQAINDLMTRKPKAENKL
jgi:glycerol-3-phosphate dehydrogenase (NAD(P)+)